MWEKQKDGTAGQEGEAQPSDARKNEDNTLQEWDAAEGDGEEMEGLEEEDELWTGGGLEMPRMNFGFGEIPLQLGPRLG